MAVPPRTQGRRLRHRRNLHHRRRGREAHARNVVGECERADRLLLRVSHDLDRPDAEQRHDRRPGGVERRQAAVRAVRVAVQAVRAACIGRSRSPAFAGCWPAGGGGASLEKGAQYDDVKDAWNHYLQNDNKGRGVVLVAHSQGSFILNRLIREEIDGKPIQSRLVSAILLGTTLEVPKGKDVGGSFKNIPLCRAAAQTGCVITYASFRSTIPPPANTLFGKVADPNMVAACTNPAALAGGSGELRAYLDRTGRTVTSTPTAEAVGHAGTADRHAVGERARSADREMRDQRERDLSGSDRQRQPVGSARRRHHRRPRRGPERPDELGIAPHRRESRDGQSRGHRRPAGEGVRGETGSK